MPLHAEYLLILVALYRLDDAIGRFGDDAHVLARLAHSLMMERVDENLFLLLFRIYFDTLINLHGDIIKTHTPRLGNSKHIPVFIKKLIRLRTVLLI